tara:strand:- start:244 stop:513 length:270 start_codon:yes stop_codon:yes gene_type:complete
MENKKAQVELAVIKGIAIALAIVSGFLIYETIQAVTPEGTFIKCNWDCSKAEWSPCIQGYSYRDVNLCEVNNIKCLESEPKPPNEMFCD